jgi:hypothetical protein
MRAKMPAPLHTHTHIYISISIVPSGLESQGNQRGFRNPRAGAVRRRSRLACVAVAVQQLGALDRNWLRWRRCCTRLPEVWLAGCIPVSGKRSESRSPLVAHSPVSQQLDTPPGPVRSGVHGPAALVARPGDLFAAWDTLRPSSIGGNPAAELTRTNKTAQGGWRGSKSSA